MTVLPDSGVAAARGRKRSGEVRGWEEATGSALISVSYENPPRREKGRAVPLALSLQPSLDRKTSASLLNIVLRPNLLEKRPLPRARQGQRRETGTKGVSTSLDRLLVLLLRNNLLWRRALDVGGSSFPLARSRFKVGGRRANVNWSHEVRYPG